MKNITILSLFLILISCGKTNESKEDQYENNKANTAVTIEDEFQIVAGQFAPDFRLPKLGSSEKVSLVDLKGKYVLVDFWASWCGPCRQENPNVKRIYEKYGGSEFEIVGISIDQNQEAWKRAVETDGLPWLNLLDKEMEISNRYNVTAIPFTVLIDKEGKILATNLRGDLLEITLEQLFAS